jgi:hypothetical protein
MVVAEAELRAQCRLLATHHHPRALRPAGQVQTVVISAIGTLLGIAGAHAASGSVRIASRIASTTSSPSRS